MVSPSQSPIGRFARCRLNEETNAIHEGLNAFVQIYQQKVEDKQSACLLHYLSMAWTFNQYGIGRELDEPIGNGEHINAVGVASEVVIVPEFPLQMACGGWR